MLVGRELERRTLRGLVAAARVGQSAALVLTGEAGIGKSALLEDAAGAATGMQVLRATGTEAEAELPFGGLQQLLAPALVHLDRIPSPQAEALASALALRPGTGADRFAIGAATLSLLSRFAEDRPLAVLVDDCHLLDPASAQALTFAARRLTVDPVVLLVALREGWSSPLLYADLPVLRVGGLSLEQSQQLLDATGRRLGAAAVARLHALTGGNPLALSELADGLAGLTDGLAGLTDGLAGLDPAPTDAPLPVSTSLTDAFTRRVDRLPATTRTALLVAATGGGDLAVVAAACRRLGADVAALGAAEDAGLVRVVGETVAFQHPLVRSAVYAAALPGRRREVHSALAAVLPEQEEDRRAWHLGEAALGPDEQVAAELGALAGRATSRGAYAVATGAFERAARLSPGAVERVQRLTAAGGAAWQAGLVERAGALLDAAAALAPPRDVRRTITALQAGIAARTGSVERARDLLVATSDEVADTDPDAAVLLLAEAVLADFLLVDTGSLARARTLLDDLGHRAVTQRARLVGALAGGMAGVLTGRGGPERIRRALQEVDPSGPLAQDPQVSAWLVLGPLFLRESGSGRELAQTVLEGVRRRSDVGALPYLLFHVGRDLATTDRWSEAEVLYAEGVRLAREADQSADLAACLAGLAWLQARQGREQDCRRNAEEAAELCRPRHIALFQCWALSALGELELALGRPEAALHPLERLEAVLTELAVADVDLFPAPELVDALVRLGRDAEAAQLAQAYAVRAAEKGQPWALARAARAVGLTRPDEELDEHFGTALAHHGRTLETFELARTQLAYGARLRRARRRVEARPLLRGALRSFEALGAAPWADAAAVELDATGETAQRRGASPLDGLTPQELQVGRMLAGGRTTREAAAALFLSPKTVEYHLRHVYVKLGIGSRAELASALEART